MSGQWVMLMGAVALSCAPAMAPLPPEAPAAPLPVGTRVADAIVGGAAATARSAGAPGGDAPADRWCERPVPSLTACQPVGKVRVRDVAVERGCYVDLLVHENDVGQIMSCPSAGVVVFEKVTFAGDYGGGRLEVCAGTTYSYPPDDNCDWKTMQRIQGPLDQLQLTYTEAPVRGTKCAHACRVTATVDRVP